MELVARVQEGNRNEVWKARLARRDAPAVDVAVRQSRRSPESLAWELNLLRQLSAEGVLVPLPIPTDSGADHDGGIVVQHWIDGRAPHSPADWQLVLVELQRVHQLALPTIGQRPGCCAVADLHRHRRSVDADLDAIPNDLARELAQVFSIAASHPLSLIHGDPGASNVRITDDQRVGLLDWDESRIDTRWLDLAGLGDASPLRGPERAAGQKLSTAWETANAWTAEPAYARRCLAELRAQTVDTKACGRD